MGRSTSVEPGDELIGFIDSQPHAGRYGSAGEIVRAGLRLLQDEEAKLAALKAALIAGEQSGEARPFDIEEFIESRKGKGRTTTHG